MATKGIWISAEIMQDTNLTQTEKYIFAEIEQLSSLEDGCYAQNSHFSALTGIAKVTVSRAISTLTEKGYTTTEIENGSRNHNRMIRVNKMIRPPIQNDKAPLTKRQETKENKQLNKQSNIQEYVKWWNDLCENSTLSPIKTLSKKRKDKILQREKETEGFSDMFESIIYKIHESDFLLGDNDQGWKVSFDWVFHNDTNYLKILEDNYKNTPKKSNAQVGSLEWERQQMISNQGVVDAELI